LFKWLGGAMFVASLACWLFWYLVLLGRPAAGVPWALAFDAGLFTLFAAHHSLLARGAVQRRLSFIPSHAFRSVYVWVASALLIAVCALWRPVGGEVYRVQGPGVIVFAAVQAAGVWMIALSVKAIDALELAGIRTPGPARADSGLQTSGPYGLVRHPLYLGWMVLVFGAAHMTADRLAFAVISSFYLVIAVPWEERSLRRSFGEAYERYEQTVRWRVIPYVY
jgi:protein-S-isoprenylcysteine O-methyltransferase Ste14